MSDWVVIGKIGAPFGVRGWSKVHSYTSPATNLLDYHNWYIGRGKSWQAIELEAAKEHGKSFVAKFAGSADRDAAADLTNLLIAVPRSSLPKLKQNDYYWSDLIGLTVVDTSGEILGQVDRLFETGGHDVLVVKGDKSECLIPYSYGDTIKKVDLSAKQIQVDWDRDYQ